MQLAYSYSLILYMLPLLKAGSILNRAHPAEILLSKPGKLSKIEYNMIKIHPQVGYDILKSIDFQQPIAQIVLQRHERIDGSGYPLGLSGEDILLEARILAVADVIEAMASHRPYRAARGIMSLYSPTNSRRY